MKYVLILLLISPYSLLGQTVDFLLWDGQDFTFHTEYSTFHEGDKFIWLDHDHYTKNGAEQDQICICTIEIEEIKEWDSRGESCYDYKVNRKITNYKELSRKCIDVPNERVDDRFSWASFGGGLKYPFQVDSISFELGSDPLIHTGELRGIDPQNKTYLYASNFYDFDELHLFTICIGEDRLMVFHLQSQWKELYFNSFFGLAINGELKKLWPIYNAY